MDHTTSPSPTIPRQIPTVWSLVLAVVAALGGVAGGGAVESSAGDTSTATELRELRAEVQGLRADVAQLTLQLGEGSRRSDRIEETIHDLRTQADRRHEQVLERLRVLELHDAATSRD